MPKIAVLLHGSIKSDYRVIKTIRSLAKESEVHLYFCGNTEDVQNHFDGFTNIQCFPLKKPKILKQKILAHSYFCYEYNFMIAEVVKSNTPYDIIWANDLPTLNAGAKLAKRLNAKLVYDSHEIFVETLNQFFLKGSNPIKNFIFDRLIKFMRKHGKKTEAQLLKHTDLMFTVNESLKHYFQENYSFHNIEVLMNLPYTQESNLVKAFNFHDFFGWDKDAIIVLYQGALNSGRGLELLIDTSSYLPKVFKIVILGSGVLKQKLKERVKRKDLENRIGFIEAVPLEALSSYTRNADVGINLLEAFNLSKKLASPNKLFEYIHAEIPVVASNTIENAKVFEKFNIGLLCENTPADVAKKIQDIVNTKDTFTKDLSAAKAHYSWGNQERDFLSAISELA